MRARRNHSAIGVLFAGLLGLGLVLAVLRYTWPLLLLASAGCLGAYFTQVHRERRTDTELRAPGNHQVTATAQPESDDLLAAAQPRSPNDSFATCPQCAHTTFQMIFAQSEAGTTRRCVSCGHQWTIDHQKQVT